VNWFLQIYFQQINKTNYVLRPIKPAFCTFDLYVGEEFERREGGTPDPGIPAPETNGKVGLLPAGGTDRPFGFTPAPCQ